jgi:hypothetical protein
MERWWYELPTITYVAASAPDPYYDKPFRIFMKYIRALDSKSARTTRCFIMPPNCSWSLYACYGSARKNRVALRHNLQQTGELFAFRGLAAEQIDCRHLAGRHVAHHVQRRMPPILIDTDGERLVIMQPMHVG